jgi:hypothetical protein
MEPGSDLGTFKTPVETRRTMGWESGVIGQNNASRVRSFYPDQLPARLPATQPNHPRVIALKNGSAYTVTKYWMKGNTLYFITTQGVLIQIPLTLLDHLYGHG